MIYWIHKKRIQEDSLKKQRASGNHRNYAIHESVDERSLFDIIASGLLHSQIPRLIVSSLVIIVVIYVSHRLLLIFKHAQAAAQSKYGPYDFQRYIPLIVYSSLPSVLSVLCDKIAKLLTKIERHENKVIFENTFFLYLESFKVYNHGNIYI